MHGPPAVCRPWLSLDHPHLPIRTPPAVGHSDGWCRVWTAAHPTTYAPPLVARYVGSRPTMLHASIFLLTPMFPASVVRRRQIAGSDWFSLARSSTRGADSSVLWYRRLSCTSTQQTRPTKVRPGQE